MTSSLSSLVDVVQTSIAFAVLQPSYCDYFRVDHVLEVCGVTSLPAGTATLQPTVGFRRIRELFHVERVDRDRRHYQCSPDICLPVGKS